MTKVLLMLIASYCVDSSRLESQQNECGIYFNNCVLNEIFKDVEESKAYKICRDKYELTK